jgi:hypothetical protein
VIAGVHYKVHCGKDTMQVDIQKRDEVSAIYLQHLKDFPGKGLFFEVKVTAVEVTRSRAWR